MVTLGVVGIVWEGKVLVALLLLFGDAVGVGAACWALRQRLQRWQSFSASLEQFKKDSACLQKPN